MKSNWVIVPGKKLSGVKSQSDQSVMSSTLCNIIIPVVCALASKDILLQREKNKKKEKEISAKEVESVCSDEVCLIHLHSFGPSNC